jgi:hypothetical protein
MADGKATKQEITFRGCMLGIFTEAARFGSWVSLRGCPLHDTIFL